MLKKLLVFIVIGAGVLFFLSRNTDLLGDKQLTYYQWNDQQGEMIISRNKPEEGIDYITFQGSSSLMDNSNQVDSQLINKAEIAKQVTNASRSSGNSKSNQGSISSTYPFSAMNKTKNCLDIAAKISAASREGKDKTALLARQKKEC